MRGCSEHPKHGRKDQLQATIIARVAYVLLHIFILSTVFRCKADVQGTWISHLASAGFAVTLLLSTALYIALTVMDPGYLPVANRLMLQKENNDQEEEGFKAHGERGRDGVDPIGGSGAISSSPGLAAVPAFDFEGLLHGAAQLPCTHSAAAGAACASAMEQRTLQDKSSSADSLSFLRGGASPQSTQKPKLAVPATKQTSSLACKLEHQPAQYLGSKGVPIGRGLPYGKAEVVMHERSPNNSADLLIGALHGPALSGLCDSEALPGGRECAWWEKPGAPGRRCEWCGAFQRLRAHHCAACERCVDTQDHHCVWLGTCIGARSQSMYLAFLMVQAASCAWAAHAVLPCLANPHPLLPWHTLFGVDWRVAATTLLLMGLLLPYLAYLLAQQLYLAATAQTARECFRRNQVTYLMHVNRRVHPFSRGCARNLWDYLAWRSERHWELPSTEELLHRQMRTGKSSTLC